MYQKITHMNSKIFVIILAVIFISGISKAQSPESTDSLTRELQEVIVKAKQPSTKLVGSTLVSTIAGSNLADLGNALDVLAQLPMIRVQDNVVSVVGKNNIEIYIDGRPMRDDMELQQILSSNLKKVELVMVPGAEYDSTTGAVLKITTRRNFVQGLSITDQLMIERRRKWSFVDYLGVNYRLGNWEWFIDGTINHSNTLAVGSTTNTFEYQGKPTKLGGSQHNSYTTDVGVVKGGFNYSNASQSFGAYYRYNPEHGKFHNTGTEWFDNDPEINRDIKKRTGAYSHLASAYYENTFADKYLLHFDGDYKHSKARNNVETIYQDTYSPDVKSKDERRSDILAGKVYLNFPLWHGNFTIGSQGSYTHTSLDYQMLNDKVSEYIPSSLTDARQTSAALFASWSRMFHKLSLKTGIRYEYVDYDFKVDEKRDDNMSRRDHLVTPDISLGYSFNDDSQISFSYKVATVRPPYSQLTGSLNYVGLHEIEGGNPGLRDERMHDVTLLGMSKGFILQADFIRSIDSYAFVKQIYPADNLQLLMHPVNIDVSALSLYLVWSRPVARWTPNITVGMYKQWLRIAGTNYDKPIFSYYFNNTFSLPYGWLITSNIYGRTEGDMHTNRFGTTWFSMDASVGKMLMNKSLTVKLTATDIFNTANNNWTMNTYGIFVDKRQSYDYRGVALNVIYNFQPRKSKYKGGSAAEDEMKRL